MKIIILYGRSRYNVLVEFAKVLNEAFIELGYESKLFSLLNNLELDELQHLWQSIKEADLICSLNGVFMSFCKDSLTDEGVNYINSQNKKIVSLYVDAPFHQKGRLQVDIGDIYNGFIDKKHIEISKKYVCKSDKQYFLPPAGIERNKCMKEDRIVFVGSYNNNYIQDYEEKLKECEGPVAFILEETVKYIISSKENISGYDALEKMFCKYGIEDITSIYDPEEDVLSWLLSIVDRYIRAYRRNLCFEYLFSSDLPVDIIGTVDESAFKITNPNVKFFKSTSYLETIDEISKHKVLINVMPFFTEGSQERIYNAMLNNVVCITDTSEYLKSEFTDGENIIFYSWNNMDIIDKACKNLLENNQLYEKYTKNAYELCNDRHRWINRAKDIIRLTMGDSRKEALQALVEYNSVLIRMITIMLGELEKGYQANADKYLLNIAQGINQELQMLNSTINYINEKEELINKNEINKVIAAFNSAYQSKDYIEVVRMLNEDILPSIRKIEEVAAKRML